MLGLFALGALTKRANARGAFVGIVACVLFTAWATLTSVKLPVLDRVLLDLGPLNFKLHPVLIWVFNHIMLFVVGLGASLWFARDAAKRSAPSGAGQSNREQG